MAGFVEIKKVIERKIRRLYTLGVDSNSLFLINSQIIRAQLLYNRSKQTINCDKQSSKKYKSRALNKLVVVEELITDYMKENKSPIKTTSFTFDEV